MSDRRRDRNKKPTKPRSRISSNPKRTGDDLKNDLRRLDALYSALPEEELKSGLINFAAYPPEDPSFLTTQLWDKHLPKMARHRRDAKTRTRS